MDRTPRSATPRGHTAAAAASLDDAAVGSSRHPHLRGSTPTDPLTRIERHLDLIGRTSASRRAMVRWRATCPELHAAGLRSPSQLPTWLRGLPTRTADAVLARLVRHAQNGDGTALVAVLACLAPGIRNVASRTPNGIDEVISEVTLGVLHYPVERRSSVAGGLLLDARNRLHRAARKAARTRPLEDTDHPPAPGELGHTGHPAQRAVQLVCQAHRQGLIDRTEARLILDTRVAGHPVKPVAQRLGLSAAAAYQRRNRAESRLTTLVA